MSHPYLLLAAFLTVVPQLHALELDEAEMAHAQRGSLVDLFRAGQPVTYTISDGSYSLMIYTEEQRARKLKEHEELLKAYEKESAEHELAMAKQKELLQELRQAKHADGDLRRIAEELNALASDGRKLTAEDLKRGFSLPPISRPGRRPSLRPFYQVQDVGKDYVAVKTGKRISFIPMWSIRSVRIEVEEND